MADCSRATSVGGFSGLLKDKESEVKLSTDEVAKSCYILSTAEYCLDTTQQVLVYRHQCLFAVDILCMFQLQEKLQERVEAQYKEQIDMNAEIDMFHR